MHHKIRYVGDVIRHRVGITPKFYLDARRHGAVDEKDKQLLVECAVAAARENDQSALRLIVDVFGSESVLNEASADNGIQPILQMLVSVLGDQTDFHSPTATGDRLT